MLVKESMKLHSAEQLEIKQEIEIDPEVARSRYSVESYFFFPPALYINKETYTEADFRRPLKSYVRLRLPKFPLSDFMEKGEEYLRLKALLADSSSSVRQREAALKRYALLIKGAFKRRIRALLASGTEEKVATLVNELRQVIAASRPLLLAAADPKEPSLAVTARAADEYLATILEYHGKRLLAHFDGGLRSFLNENALYREKYYPESASWQRPEDVLYRWRSLKKFISSQLFLVVKMREGNPWLLQSLYGIAAAVSMIFATVVAFLWQGKYGALSWNLFLALVIAYIFKDRLKDWMRARLAKLFRRWLPSRRQLIYANDGRMVGVCRESFDFVKRAEVPPEILTLRTKAHYVPFAQEEAESIFLYRKDVELHNEWIHSYENRSSLYDITRIGVMPWTNQIDLQFEELPFVDEDDERAHAPAAKLYHVYLVRRIRVERPKHERFEVTRLVLKHDRLLTLERVLAGEKS